MSSDRLTTGSPRFVFYPVDDQWHHSEVIIDHPSAGFTVVLDDGPYWYISEPDYIRTVDEHAHALLMS